MSHYICTECDLNFYEDQSAAQQHYLIVHRPLEIHREMMEYLKLNNKLLKILIKKLEI